MARLSINSIHADMMLAQIKTGEFYTVLMVDLVAKKVTIADMSGEEKNISKATLERWYRELTEDEVQQFNESSETEQIQGTDADKENAGNETEEQSDESQGKDMENKAEETGEGSSTDDVESSDEDGIDNQEDGKSVDGSDSESVRRGEEHIEGTSGEDSNQDKEPEQGEDGISSPVTPSNARSDKDKSKQPVKPEPKNAALMKVRQQIIDTILADSPSIQLKKTSAYDVLKEKHNFAEITHGSNRFNVSVMSKCLTEDQLNKVKVNPASFGWSIDADFTVFDETDIEMAITLIRQSREYRLANPVTRKKKANK